MEIDHLITQEKLILQHKGLGLVSIWSLTVKSYSKETIWRTPKNVTNIVIFKIRNFFAIMNFWKCLQ